MESVDTWQAEQYIQKQSGGRGYNDRRDITRGVAVLAKHAGKMERPDRRYDEFLITTRF
jgi:hypothetical protein